MNPECALMLEPVSDVIQFCQFLAETYPGELETSSTQHISVLYVRNVPCKNWNDFLPHTASNIRHTVLYCRTSQTCGHRVVLTCNLLTIKCGESCRSMSTALPYSTLHDCCMVWRQQHVIDEAFDQRCGRLCTCVGIDGQHL